MDCKYVLHVASPFTMYQPKKENKPIKPTKEGTLRALRSAQKAGLKRLVLTSCISAMISHMKNGKFDTSSWIDFQSSHTNAYHR